MTAFKPQTWRLTPHRSLSPGGRRALLGGTAAISAVMAGVFIANGLWPLAIFAAIPPLGLAFGLAASTRSGREWQDIALDARSLTITHHQPGWPQPRVTVIPAGWLRVETVMDEKKGFAEEEDPPRCERILLKTRGRAYEIGAFLPPDDKLAFARVLRAALADWGRYTPPAPAL